MVGKVSFQNSKIRLRLRRAKSLVGVTDDDDDDDDDGCDDYDDDNYDNTIPLARFPDI